MLDPTGRVAMISGANRGLGLAISRRLSAEGYLLSLGARDLDALAAATADFDDERTIRHRYDAHDRSCPASWVAATVDRFGSLSAVVNNAGAAVVAPLEETTEDQLDEMWEVNVKAPLRTIQAALPHLRADGEGRIVNVASMSGKRVKSGRATAYEMSKFAMMALSASARFAGWDDGVRVTALCPSWMATGMGEGFGIDPATMSQPEDVSALVATVLSLPNTSTVPELLVNCRLEP
ncbi:MAG: SDR family NAD(P)-dependent oxidoreductase [Acidimicrobiales bacterium]